MMLQIAGIKIQLAISAEYFPKTDYFTKACADYSVPECSKHDIQVLLENFNGISHLRETHLMKNGVSYIETGDIAFFYSDSSSCRISWKENTATLSFASNVFRYDVLFMDYIKLALSFIAIKRGGLPLHSSAVHKEGRKGLLFFCQSGGGKTTIARLLSREWKVLSDEYNLVMPENGGYYIHSTPFTAPENYPLGSVGRAPATGFYALTQSPANSLGNMTFREKYLALGKGVYTIPATRDICGMLLGNMHEICARIPIQRLFFINNQSIIHDIDHFSGNRE